MNPVRLLAFALVLSPLAAFVTNAADAPANWTKHCAKCHAADGSGSTKMGKKLQLKDYTKQAVQAKLTDAELLKATVDGVVDEAGKERMPAYKEKLSDQEAKDLVAYIRTMVKPEAEPAK